MNNRLFLIPILFLATSCSVMMAADCGGVNPDAIDLVSSRAELLAIGARPLFSEAAEDGVISETFLVPRKHGSIGRAIMHGTLDLISGFMWELAATPIESKIDGKESFCLKVRYDSSMHILDSTIF